MNRDSDQHPDPEVLAAFVASNLVGAELQIVLDHVLECEDCQVVVAEGARFERDQKESLPAVALSERGYSPWWLVAAAAALVGIAVLSFWSRTNRENPSIRALVEASPRSARYLEPRITGGFAWAPLKATRTGQDELDPGQMKLVGAAGEVLEKATGDSSAEASHVVGVARLLAGEPDKATEALTQAATSAPSARLWSDLSAARYAAAVEQENPQQLIQALAAVDQALRLEPGLPEALFNRGLILEHLGLREQARQAWKRYLDVDRSSAWAREAEKHLAALTPAVEFKTELERHYARLSSDAEAANAMVARFPQDARVWGESEILDRWAQKQVAGDQEAAALHLRVAHFLGRALSRFRGEHLLYEAVLAIESADAGRARMLADAHILFREAQRTFKAKRPAEAERQFREAEKLFAAAGSPMALLARYFAANTTYEQDRTDEARIQLEGVLREAGLGYPALIAQVKWQLGLVQTSLGRWGQAMHYFGESIAGFDRLGEKKYAMTVRELLAQVHDRLGEPREGWTHRLEALQELGQTDDMRLRATLQAVARGAALNRDWPVSLSFLNLQTESARHTGDEQLYVHALLSRARILGQLGESSGALADFHRATAAMTGLEDPALLRHVQAERVAVEGFLATSPARAIESFSNAIEFHRTRGRRMFLPEMFLHRGRAFAASGAPEKAATDFETGISELESQRNSVGETDHRWGIFGTADELFDEAAQLALQRKDDAAAFAYCERARARELLDPDLSVATPAETAAPSNAVILAYLLLPSRLVIFIVDASGIRAHQEAVPSATVATEVDLLLRNATSGDTVEFRRMATRLYDRLLAPVAAELASGRMLVVVPDQTLSVVPFAALIDPAGRYVIEGRAVVVAPSAAAYRRLSSRGRALRAPSTLLLVSGPASQEGNTSVLTASRREAAAIASLYTTVAELAPRDQVAETLAQHAAQSEVIHFVGHAIIPDSTSGPALVTSQREGLDAQFDAREISALDLPRTRVVVLAACGTARAYGRTGDGSISLARAFLAAGASAVVATLWPIEDEPAAEFFPRIHHYLARGLPPAEALRAAQLEWVQGRNAPPGVWAAVQVIGS